MKCGHVPRCRTPICSAEDEAGGKPGGGPDPQSQVRVAGRLGVVELECLADGNTCMLHICQNGGMWSLVCD